MGIESEVISKERGSKTRVKREHRLILDKIQSLRNMCVRRSDESLVPLGIVSQRYQLSTGHVCHKRSKILSKEAQKRSTKP